MKLSSLQWNVIKLTLEDFKNSHAIHGKGSIFNYQAGEWLYDYITSDSEGEPPIAILIEETEKKKLWREANKGFAIQLWDKTRKDVTFDEDLRKKEILRIYKTLLVTHHLNVLADNEQFVNIELPINLK